MHRILLARECGDDAEGLDDDVTARWTRLKEDPRRDLPVSICAAELTTINIDTSGTLLLCGGRSLADSPNRRVALGLYRCPASRRPVDTKPLAVARERQRITSSITCAAWYPHDTDVFVTGMLSGRTVNVWDTEIFKIAATLTLSTTPAAQLSVCTVALSPLPSARTELVATACLDLPYVTIIDLASGTHSHVLQSDRPSAAVHDVAWSPTNPHQLASVDTDGQVALFDIRRSGTVACLATMSERSSQLPKRADAPLYPSPTCSTPAPQIISAGRATPSTRVATPLRKSTRARNLRSAVKKVTTPLTDICKPPLLGLGCAWRPVSMRAGNSGLEPPIKEVVNCASSKLRFTHDGMTLVSQGTGRGFFTHDVFTGRLLTSFRGRMGTARCLEESIGFEVARDGDHLITTLGNSLCLFDMYTGGIVHLLRARHGYWRAFALHPLEEEVFSVHDEYIASWTECAAEEERP